MGEIKAGDLADAIQISIKLAFDLTGLSVELIVRYNFTDFAMGKQKM